MNNLFKTNEVNLKQAKAHVKAFGVCFLHADGNMFSEEKDSDFRKDYCNPKAEASKYRVKFTSVDQVPDTVEDLEKLFLEAKNRELNEAAKPESVSTVKTLEMEDDEPKKKGAKK